MDAYATQPVRRRWRAEDHFGAQSCDASATSAVDRDMSNKHLQGQLMVTDKRRSQEWTRVDQKPEGPPPKDSKRHKYGVLLPDIEPRLLQFSFKGLSTK
jgi:hypothetical protein